jgi:DNA repair protein RadC
MAEFYEGKAGKIIGIDILDYIIIAKTKIFSFKEKKTNLSSRSH